MPGGLLRRPDFRLLWAADALSQLGTRISFLALPLLATQFLQASAFQVSLLRTLETVAHLVLGLQVGAWCDRMRSRPVLIVADLARAVALGSVPLAAALGALSLAHLYAAVLVTGLFTVYFDVAHRTYLPRLIERDALVEGNARLQANKSVAAVAAPSASGLLVQWFGGPMAILGNALSYLASAAWLARIRHREPAPPRPAQPRLRTEIAEGLRLVFGHPILRALAGNGATLSLFQSVHVAIVVVFLVREVHLSAGMIGLLSSIGLTGAVLGALVARRLAARLGQARVLWLAALGCGLSYLLYPLTGPGWWLACYAVAGFGAAFGIILLNVLAVSFQQAISPPRLLGRMHATINFLILGAAPIGSMLGGVLAEAIGLRATLWVAATGVLGSAGWLVFSPLRTIRDLPDECAPATAGSQGR